jgi:hypothetical protein
MNTRRRFGGEQSGNFGHERFGIRHRFSKSLNVGQRFGGVGTRHAECSLVVPQVGVASSYAFFPADFNVNPKYRWNRDFPGTAYDLDLFWATYASAGGPYFYRVDDHDAETMDERGFSSVMAVPYISARDSRENPPWSQFGHDVAQRFGEDSRTYPGGYFGEDSRKYDGGMFGARFGTVMGVYSVAELHDLINAKDVEMAAIGGQIAHAPAAQLQADPTLKTDWQALFDRYSAAKTVAQAAISHAMQLAARVSSSSLQSLNPFNYIADSILGAPSDATNATPEVNAAYQGIITALQQTPGVVSEGDKQDIAARLMKAGWKPKYKVPQPEKKSDVDQQIYQKTDPSNIHIPSFHIPAWVWVGGAAAVGLLGYTAIKVGLVAAKATPLGMAVLR